MKTSPGSTRWSRAARRVPHRRAGAGERPPELEARRVAAALVARAAAGERQRQSRLNALAVTSVAAIKTPFIGRLRSNSARSRVWKTELQKLANETGLTVSVVHFPPGTSTWNKVEHRLFSHITMNWRPAARGLRDRRQAHRVDEDDDRPSGEVPARQAQIQPRRRSARLGDGQLEDRAQRVSWRLELQTMPSSDRVIWPQALTISVWTRTGISFDLERLSAAIAIFPPGLPNASRRHTRLLLRSPALENSAPSQGDKRN